MYVTPTPDKIIIVSGKDDFMSFIILILGLVLIIKSADILIDSASRIARGFGISTFIIGITVVAFGTSAPELVVGLVSGINHTNQLTLGNIIGSTLSNTALIIGLSAILYPLQVSDSVVRREIPLSFFVQILLSVMVLSDGVLSRWEGLILLFSFLLFMVYVTRSSRQSMRIQIDPEGDIDTDGDGNGLPQEPDGAGKKTGNLKLWTLLVLGLAGLFIGGRIIVTSSVEIAAAFGLSETLIGLTVVALGTTMPELVTSIMAVVKKEPEIVIGNCIGSNIFNILLVLGSSATISPILVEGSLYADIGIMLLFTLFVLIVSLMKKKLERMTGIVLFLGYISYLLFKIISVSI